MKAFYSGGFLYNPYSKKVLLHLRDDETDHNPNTWAFFGGLSKAGETPEKTFQREMREELNARILLSVITPLYDYLNEELNVHRYVFYVSSREVKGKLKLKEGKDLIWVAIPQALKMKLSSKTRQDLTFFQREMNAKTRK